MKIKVLFFARLRETLGSRGEELELPDGAVVDDLLSLLAGRSEQWQQELQGGRIVRVAVNQDMAAGSTPLRAGDEVALFPPVTGG